MMDYFTAYIKKPQEYILRHYEVMINLESWTTSAKTAAKAVTSLTFL